MIHVGVGLVRNINVVISQINFTFNFFKMSKKLPFKTFLKTFELVPRAAVCILPENSKGEILLTKRAIPPFKDYWHIAGSFILKGEKIADCIKRVGREELNLNIDPKLIKLLGVFENIDGDRRGHAIDIIYGYKVDEVLLSSTKESKEIKFFKNLPSKIGFGHKKTLNNIKKVNI